MMLGIIMAFSFNANAQNDKKENKRQFNPEKMVQMRATKIAEDLKLDDATTAKFIEVYKEYLKETHEVFAKNGKPMMGKKDEKVRKTDAEVEKEIKDQFATSRALIDVRDPDHPVLFENYSYTMHYQHQALIGAARDLNKAGFGLHQLAYDLRPSYPRPEFYDNMFKKWGLTSGGLRWEQPGKR